MPLALPARPRRETRLTLVGRGRAHHNQPTEPDEQGEQVTMERIRLDEERQALALRRGAQDEHEPMASTAAIFDAAGRAQEPGRGATPTLGRAIGGLHATAGNGAVAQLFGGTVGSSHGEGVAQVRAGHTALGAQPVVQREPDEEPAPEQEIAPSPDGSAGELAEKPPTPGPSWTHVGPPTPASYDVSGSLRAVANAVAARTEAGSVTATPTKDTETWTPAGGTEKVTAARVTVDQVLELPNWTDKSNATKNQQAEWDRFHAAITTHENGHVTQDKTSFAGTHAKMVGKSPTDADTALNDAATQAKTDNDTYDAGNDHGLKQGTGINPNIDEVTKVP